MTPSTAAYATGTVPTKGDPMLNCSRTSAKTDALKEVVVPTIMIVGIGFFVLGSLNLSTIALILPAILIAVVAIALIVVTWQALRRAPSGQPGAFDDEDARGPILALRPWLIVALPALAVFLFQWLGTLAALIALVFFSQVMFSSKSSVRSLAIAIAVTAPTYYLFKHVLYARFAPGLLGIG